MADPAEPVTDQPGRQEEKIGEVEKAAGEEGGAPTDGESAVAKVNIYKYFFILQACVFSDANRGPF